MRILILNHEYPPVGGGASNASHFLANSLVELGHHVHVVTSAFQEERGPSVEGGVNVVRLPAMRRRADRAGVFQMLSFVVAASATSVRRARREGIEAVIAYFTLPSGLIALQLRHRLGLPYVISLQGGDVPGLVPEMDRTHRLLRRPRRAVLRSARSIIANSQGLADLSSSRDPFPVQVVRNGVDCELFRPPATPRPPTEPFRILFAGRLHRQKNVSLLLDQLSRLHEDGFSHFELHVAGDGPLRRTLQRQAERLGLSGRIVWHGWLGKSEVVQLLQSADCFVNPSFYEGLPNAVTEAMACGLPVVASRVIGNDALVTHRTTGLLFGLDQPDDLGAALLSLMSDREEARSMGRAGRRVVVQEYSWRNVASEYLALLGATEDGVAADGLDDQPPGVESERRLT